MRTSPAAQTSSLISTADLIGAWSLESYTDTAEGEEAVLPLGPSPQGMLIYTPDGFMSAQLMSLDRPPLDAGDRIAEFRADIQENSGGYIGYSGEYHFDEVKATVSHMPSVSFVPSLTGQRLKRRVELVGNRLTLTVVTSRGGGKSVESALCWLRLDGKPAER